MHRPFKGTRPETMAERETQILDGLRMADLLLASFGRPVGHIDVAALVTLRTLQWADDSTTVGEVRRILSAIPDGPADRVVG